MLLYLKQEIPKLLEQLISPMMHKSSLSACFSVIYFSISVLGITLICNGTYEKNIAIFSNGFIVILIIHRNSALSLVPFSCSKIF